MINRKKCTFNLLDSFKVLGENSTLTNFKDPCPYSGSDSVCFREDDQPLVYYDYKRVDGKEIGWTFEPSDHVVTICCSGMTPCPFSNKWSTQ